MLTPWWQKLFIRYLNLMSNDTFFSLSQQQKSITGLFLRIVTKEYFSVLSITSRHRLFIQPYGTGIRITLCAHESNQFAGWKTGFKLQISRSTLYSPFRLITRLPLCAFLAVIDIETWINLEELYGLNRNEFNNLSNDNAKSSKPKSYLLENNRYFLTQQITCFQMK